jgi:hypothetical protein
MGMGHRTHFLSSNHGDHILSAAITLRSLGQPRPCVRHTGTDEHALVNAGMQCAFHRSQAVRNTSEVG